MAEVNEIITKLGYEVTGQQSVKGVTDNLEKQVGAIDAMKEKLAQLQQAMSTTTNVNEQQKLSNAILKTKKAIDDMTASASKQVAGSKVVQQEIQKELGIIQKLNDKLLDLKRARDTQTTVAGIKQIDAAISDLNDELNSLNTKGNFISQLLGFGSAGGTGKQILQGALAGLGIGVGFSVLPAIISKLTEYTTLLVSTTEQTKQIASANNSLASSFDNILDKIIEIKNIDLQAVYNDFLPDDAEAAAALLGQTPQGLKDKIDQLKALGALNGQVYLFEQEQLKLNQNLLRAENTELEKRKQTIEETLAIFEKTRTQAGSVSTTLVNQLKTIVSLGTGEALTGAENAGKFLRGTNLPKNVIDDLSVALIEAAKSGADLNQVIDKTIDKLKAQNFQVKQQITTNLEAQKNLETEAQRKNLEGVRQLDLQLKKGLLDAQQKYEQDKLAIQDKSADNVTELIRKQTDFQIAEIQRGLVEQRKKLATDENGKILPQFITDPATNKQILFDPEKTAIDTINKIREDGRLLETEAKRKFYIEQITLAAQYNQQALAEEIRAAKQRLSEVSTIELTENLDLRRTVIDKELQLQQAGDNALFTQQIFALKKTQQELEAAKQTETEQYKQVSEQIIAVENQFAQREEDNIRAANIRKLTIYADYYKQVINVAELQRQQLSQTLQADASGELLGIEQGGGGFFGRAFQRRIQDLRTQQKQAEIDRNAALSSLDIARDRLRNATKKQQEISDLGGTPAESNAATLEVQAAGAAVDELTKKTNDAEIKGIQTGRTIKQVTIAQYLEMYQSITDIAVQSYNTINEARQKDLEREISAREQRVEVALQLAERGNTEVLALEQKALEQAQQARRKAALEQQAVNAALSLSNSILAISQAAALPPPSNFAVIAAVIAAIANGYAQVTALSRSSQTTGFADGGYTGDGGKYESAGTVHKGEFVFTKEKTAEYRPLFEAIHKGLPVPITPSYVEKNSKQDVAILAKQLDNVIDAINGKKVIAKQTMDKNGLAQSVVEVQTKERIKWLA